ncbi:TPA: hypothetical protein ACJGT4_003415 [Salmonella enterica subsp. enterica]
MSNDITALAQRTDLLMENALETANQLRELQESAVAEAIFESVVENENGKEIQFERPISDLAYAAFLQLKALVEALERAQQQIQAHERAELTWMNALDLPDEATRNDILPAIHAEKYLLRNANTHISKLERANAAQDDHINQQQDRIAELDQRLIEYAGIATSEARRVAELEARTVSIPEVRITVAESKRKNLTWRELGAYNEGADVAKEKILAAIRAAGIKVKES